MSGEHEEVQQIWNESDPNAEYQEPEPAVEQEAASGEEAPIVDEPVVEGGEGDLEVEQPAYEPDYSFNVRGEQKEMDDWAKSLIKDKESEEYFRSVMAKVHGIEGIQEARDNYKQKFEATDSEYTEIKNSLGRLAHFRDQGNYEAVFKELGIKEEEALKYAQARLQYHEMSPEQRQAYDQQHQLGVEQYDLQAQNQALLEERNQYMAQTRQNEVELVLSRPEVTEFATAFDQRMGRVGAFKEEVWNRGAYHATVHKTDISAEQAVDEVLKLVGGDTLGRQPQAEIPPQTPSSPTMAAPKPVIPKVSGSGSSPTRPIVSSVSDILKLRRERFGS